MEPETAAFPPLPPIFSGGHPLRRYHILCVLENNFGRIHKNIRRFLAGVLSIFRYRHLQSHKM